MSKKFDALVLALDTLTQDQKDAILKLLQPQQKPYTTQDAVNEINALPQNQYIDDLNLYQWLAKVKEYDPNRMSWHVRRLSGFGGSEIGTLWMSLRDQFHPFHSCTDVVEGKWLRQEPLAPEGNLQRGSMMEDPILRVKFREEMSKKYAAEGKTVKFRDDLFPQFMNFQDPDPQLSWLIGSPDDILEVDGKLIIVDYKAPTSGTIAAYASYPSDQAPIYYEAQLHHYSTIAQKLGLEVSSTMLASLDYDKFTFDLRYIPLRPQFQQELLDAGSHYWHNHVLTGISPSPGTQKAFSKEVELPQNMQDLAKKYAILSTIMNAAKKARDNVQLVAANTCTPIDTDLDVIVSGMVNVEAQRVIDTAGLEEALKSFGISTDHAHGKSDWDVPSLVRFAKAEIGIDDDTDPSFDSLRQKNTAGSVDEVNPQTLMQIARKENIPLAPYIISEAAKFNLSRTKSGIAPALREALALSNNTVELMSIQTLSNVYDDTKAALTSMNQANSAKPKPVI